MKTLGLLLIGVGLLLCLTFFFAPWGFGAIIAGALCYMAADKKPSHIGVITPGAGRRAAIACSILIAVMLLAAAAHRMTAPHAKSPQALPVPRTEANRVHPEHHAETAKVSQAR